MNNPKVLGSNLMYALIAGIIFSIAHQVNGLIFQNLSFSIHIAWIYLPAFLRLANVLVLGYVWGSAGTFIGCLILMVFNETNTSVEFPNDIISSLGGGIALAIFSLTTKREVSFYRLTDWIQLTIYCTFSNAIMHHTYWFIFDSNQVIESKQLSIMMIGDAFGTLFGAFLFSYIARLIAYKFS